jgi:nucleoid-associated protein YgaU
MARGLTGVRSEPSVPPIIGVRAGWLWPGHHAIIQSWEGRLAVVALLQDQGAHPAATGAEWEVVARPQKEGVTEWKGNRNRELELALRLDRWIAGGDVERQIDQLEEMVRTPLTVRVVGPIPYWGVRWAIQTIDYGDYRRDDTTARRVRQDFTLHLLEYVQPDTLVKIPRAGAEPKPTRTYTIVKGDDLQKIAQKALGKASRWPEIAKLNAGMRGIKLDPKKFKVGAKIKVPGK